VKFVILGASGFIGSHLARYLRGHQHDVLTPGRDDNSSFDGDLGHVVYCAGLTADFRERPYDTVAAHVCRLSEILRKTRFESFLYLSSTRVYARARAGDENEVLHVDPLDSSDLYNLSKLMGESICFSSRRPNTRVVRLSNVYGPDFSSANFVFSLIKDAIDTKKIILSTSLDSEKDYVSVKDVVSILPRIALHGHHCIYNVASGVNTKIEEILKVIQHRTGCTIKVAEKAQRIFYPRISIDRLRTEFNYAPSSSLTNAINELISVYESTKGQTSASREQSDAIIARSNT